MKIPTSLVATVLGLALAAPAARAQSGARRGLPPASTSSVVASQQPAPATQAGAPQPGPEARPGRPGGRQGAAGGRGAGQLPDPDVLGPNQVDQLLDTWMIVQAQPFLNLNDNQWLMFAQKLKNLQNIRRRVQKQRHDTLVALQQMMQNPGPLEEAVVTERLRTFDELSAQAAPELRQAYLDIDKLLNPRQRVRFRVFEERMEQKKMELIAQARKNQQGRSNQPPQGAVKK